MRPRAGPGFGVRDGAAGVQPALRLLRGSAVRGREFSRPAAEVLCEVERLVATGKDVTLLGQSVMSYGRSNPVWEAHARSARGLKEPFPRLLEALGNVRGLQRVRFTSWASDKLVGYFWTLTCMCRKTLRV